MLITMLISRRVLDPIDVVALARRRHYLIGGARVTFREIEQVPAIGSVTNVACHVGELGYAAAAMSCT
jgi:hypothetical protein